MLNKLIKNIKQETKYLYLKNLSSDKYESFLKKEYKERTGEDLDIENPRTYTEKMQYAKLYLNSPLKTKLTDKYLVRDWVKEKIGSDYLIPLLGVWDNFSDIDFNELPKKFVLKTNHSSGWNLVVNDKENLDYQKAKRNFDRWMSKNFAYNKDLQLHYKDIEPKILAEEFIQDSTGDLKDYKFMCFNGKPYYCWVDMGKNKKQYRNMYDMEWNLQPWNVNVFENFPDLIPEPENYGKMVELAEILAQGFSHVRVDLYNVDGEIYFGEMTFTSSGGYTLMYPKKYNRVLGDLWDIDLIQ